MQVLINLVKNATKFTSKGFILIQVQYDRESQTLMTCVRDTGLGISQDEIPTLFNKFGKLHRTAEINSAGIGLGLTVVKEIVELAGGAVYAESDGPNKGSVFTFTMVMREVQDSPRLTFSNVPALPHDSEKLFSSPEPLMSPEPPLSPISFKKSVSSLNNSEFADADIASHES